MLAEIEDAILDALREAFETDDGRRPINSFEVLPGTWNADLLKEVAAKAPALFVHWDGGATRRLDQPAITSRYFVYAVARTAAGRRARQTGGPLSIGAYEMLEIAVPVIHELNTDFGTLELERIDNVYSGSASGRGLSIYAAEFRMPTLFPASRAADVPGMDDFLLYAATHRVGDGDTPDVETRQEMEHD